MTPYLVMLECMMTLYLVLLLASECDDPLPGNASGCEDCGGYFFSQPGMDKSCEILKWY